LLYALLAVLAGAALAPYAPGLRLVSGLALLAFGGHGLWKALQVNGRGEDAQPAEDPRGLAGVYTRFLGLTLLNPLTIAYFGALILGRDAAAAATTLDRALFVVGAGLASLSWQTLLAGLGALGNRRLSPGFRRGASIGGNLVVIALGARILVFASQ
ncbi:MAG TPA: LysE family transporter, partial [Anaerolineales bacterium]|nr:LysE family transporter [Anaerolineales bacterium]